MIQEQRRELSVTEYARERNLTRQAILWQILNDKLPAGVTARKIGATYVIFAENK